MRKKYFLWLLVMFFLSSCFEIKKLNFFKQTNKLTRVDEDSYIGIALIFDSTTGISRSFSFYKLLKNHPVFVNQNRLVPVMVDYQFNSPYAISGISTENFFKLKFYKSGKKIKEATIDKNWKKIYDEIANTFGQDPVLTKNTKPINIEHLKKYSFKSNRIRECFPGRIAIQVPSTSIIDTFRRFANIQPFPLRKKYEDVVDLYKKFTEFDERKLFFFRNGNVPYSVIDIAEHLVTPLYTSLMPCLTYLSVGHKLKMDGDYGAAVNCFLSSLQTSNNLLASPYEKALSRAMAFKELSLTHLATSQNRIETSKLFYLGYEINFEFTSSQDAKQQRKDYYKNIGKIEKICTEAENKALSIRSQERTGYLMALTSAATAYAYSKVDNYAMANAELDQGEKYITASLESSSKISSTLYEQFKGVNNKVNTSSFLTEGNFTDLGRSYLADEVCYYLLKYPQLIKNILIRFANDKPKLKVLVKNFYEPGNSKNISAIYLQLFEIEKYVLNYEIRGKKIDKIILDTF